MGRVPAHFGRVFRVLQTVRPWGMVEVFMLGVLVSLVKLAHLAGVVAGVALWSFAALMLVMAGITAVFDVRGTVGEGERTAMSPPAPSAATGARLGLLSCHVCGQLSRASPARTRRVARAAPRRCIFASPTASPAPGRC